MIKEADIYHLETRQKRLVMAIEYKKIEFPVSEIAKKTLYSEPSISQMINGNRKVTSKFLEIFCKVYSFDFEKMKTGLFNDNSNDKNNVSLPSRPVGNEVKQVSFDNFMEVPYLPVYAQAGYLSSIAQNRPMQPDTILVPKEFEKGNYIVIEVEGDSMDDGTRRSICAGDKILVKELDPTYYRDSPLYFKKNLYVIMHKDGIVLKQVIKHDVEKGVLTCHSWNDKKRDYSINLEDVYRICYYKKTVERKLLM